MSKLIESSVRPGPEGYAAVRVYHRKALGKNSPRLLIRCGDCSNKLEIHYDPEDGDFEIGGVLASTMNWREILLPLLKTPPPIRRD